MCVCACVYKSYKIFVLLGGGNGLGTLEEQLEKLDQKFQILEVITEKKPVKNTDAVF